MASAKTSLCVLCEGIKYQCICTNCNRRVCKNCWKIHLKMSKCNKDDVEDLQPLGVSVSAATATGNTGMFNNSSINLYNSTTAGNSSTSEPPATASPYIRCVSQENSGFAGRLQSMQARILHVKQVAQLPSRANQTLLMGKYLWTLSDQYMDVFDTEQLVITKTLPFGGNDMCVSTSGHVIIARNGSLQQVSSDGTCKSLYPPNQNQLAVTSDADGTVWTVQGHVCDSQPLSVCNYKIEDSKCEVLKEWKFPVLTAFLKLLPHVHGLLRHYHCRCTLIEQTLYINLKLSVTGPEHILQRFPMITYGQLISIDAATGKLLDTTDQKHHGQPIMYSDVLSKFFMSSDGGNTLQLYDKTYNRWSYITTKGETLASPITTAAMDKQGQLWICAGTDSAKLYKLQTI